MKRLPCGARGYAAAACLAPVVAALCSWLVLHPDFTGRPGSLYQAADYVTYYEPVARNLLAGHGFTLPAGEPAVRYPPGYPVLLAAVFGLSQLLHISEDALYTGFVLLCLAAASWLIFRLASSVWGAKAGLLSSLIWSTYPLILWLSSEPKVEIVFMPPLYGGFYLFRRALSASEKSEKAARLLYFLAGVLVGAAMLIHPIAIGLGVVLAGAIWLLRREGQTRSKLLASGLLLLGNLAAVAPWEAWVYGETATVAPLSTGGLPSVVDGLTFAANPGLYRSRPALPSGAEQLMEEMHRRELNHELTSYGGVISALVEEGSRHPFDLAELLIVKAARSLYGTDSGRLEVITAPLQAIYILALVAAGLTAWRRGGTARRFALSICLPAAYFWGMSIMVLSIARYMVPAIGLSFALVAALLAEFKPFSPRARP